MISEQMFQNLVNVIAEQQQKIASIATHLSQIESIGGGGGSASIEDYESGKHYKRNVLLVDPNTETMYRVLTDYTSDTVANDVSQGLLKLVGFDSQIVTFNHKPTQAEINALPNDVIVAVYSSNDTPYQPDT